MRFWAYVCLREAFCDSKQDKRSTVCDPWITQLDEGEKGYLTEEETAYGLRAINPNLSTSERTYLFRVRSLYTWNLGGYCRFIKKTADEDKRHWQSSYVWTKSLEKLANNYIKKQESTDKVFLWVRNQQTYKVQIQRRYWYAVLWSTNSTNTTIWSFDFSLTTNVNNTKVNSHIKYKINTLINISHSTSTHW